MYIILTKNNSLYLRTGNLSFRQMTRWYLSKSSNPKCKPYPNGNLTCRQMINRIAEGLSWILHFLRQPLLVVL